MGIALLVWIMCGIGGAAILSRFGQAGQGCIIGTLLGPIGVIIALYQREQEMKKERAATEAKQEANAAASEERIAAAVARALEEERRKRGD